MKRLMINFMLGSSLALLFSAHPLQAWSFKSVFSTVRNLCSRGAHDAVDDDALALIDAPGGNAAEQLPVVPAENAPGQKETENIFEELRANPFTYMRNNQGTAFVGVTASTLLMQCVYSYFPQLMPALVVSGLVVGGAVVGPHIERRYQHLANGLDRAVGAIDNTRGSIQSAIHDIREHQVVQEFNNLVNDEEGVEVVVAPEVRLADGTIQPEQRERLVGGARALHRGAGIVLRGAGEGLNQGLVGPAIANAADRAEPAVRNLEVRVDRVSNNLNHLVDRFKGLGMTTFKVIAGSIALWYGTRFLFNSIEKYLTRPRLEVILKKASAKGPAGNIARQMIFAPEIRDRLNTVLQSTLAIKNSLKLGTEGIAYRTLLLYGPTGSGKRMFTEQLAQYTRMDFYEIPWSSFNKLKDTDLDKAIEQFFGKDLSSSSDGAIVYIDHAHPLFSHKSARDTSPHRARLISALVEHVERAKNVCMVVFGMTEKPGLGTDTAMIIDDIVEVTLPADTERIKLLRLYRDLYFAPNSMDEEAAKAVQSVLSDEALSRLSRRLNNASAAELAAFMKTLKVESELPSSDGLTSVLIEELIENILERSEKRLAAIIGS